MSIYHDEIEIEDMEWCQDEAKFYYPCPCGDQFEITLDELEGGEDVAKCPSCSLIIRIIFEEADLSRLAAGASQSGVGSAVSVCA